MVNNTGATGQSNMCNRPLVLKITCLQIPLYIFGKMVLIEVQVVYVCDCQVDWSGVKFKHETRECKQHGLAKNNQYIYRFDTTYVNNTKVDQTYNFNVQRRQLAQSRIEMTEGYLTGKLDNGQHFQGLKTNAGIR